MTSANDPGAPGTMNAVPKRRAHVAIERELCKGCGFCIEFCPAHALEPDTGFNAKGYHPPRLSRPEACVGCNMCGLYCPDFAIFGRVLTASEMADKSAGPRANEEASHTEASKEASR